MRTDEGQRQHLGGSGCVGLRESRSCGSLGGLLRCGWPEIEEPRCNFAGALKGRALRGWGLGARPVLQAGNAPMGERFPPVAKKFGFRGCAEAKVIATFLLVS